MTKSINIFRTYNYLTDTIKITTRIQTLSNRQCPRQSYKTLLASLMNINVVSKLTANNVLFSVRFSHILSSFVRSMKPMSFEPRWSRWYLHPVEVPKVDVVSCSRCWPELLAARWHPLRYSDARTLSSCASSSNGVILPDHEQFLPCFITTWRRYPEWHWKGRWSHNVQSNGPLLSSYRRFFCASDLAFMNPFSFTRISCNWLHCTHDSESDWSTIFRLRLLTLAEIPLENDSVAVSLQLTPVGRLPRCLGRAAREAVCGWFGMSAGELLRVHELLITLWGMTTDDICSRE